MKRYSIRRRLTFGTSLLLSVIFLIGSVVIYQGVRGSLYSQLDEQLHTSLSLMILEVEIVGDRVENEWLEDLGKDALRIEREYVQTWDVVTGFTKRSPALDGEDLPKIFGDLEEEITRDVILEGSGKKLRAVGITIYPKINNDNDNDNDDDDNKDATISAFDHPHIVVMAFETKAIERTLSHLFRTLLVGLIAAISVCVFGGYYFVRSSLRPLKKLEQDLAQVDINDPHALINAPDEFPEELTGLVEKYRDLLDRIGRVRVRERDFSANAAHELRTPLAGIQATLEQTLALDRSGEDYRRRVGTSLKIAIGMRSLVDRLLHFSRLQNGTETAEMVEVNLNETVDERLCSLERKISGRELKVEKLFGRDDLVVVSDQSLLRILVGNLVDNAVSHAEEKSTIRIELIGDDVGGKLIIINTLFGMDVPDMDRIFEPFYTEDEAHFADSEHSGLGLALSREIATFLKLGFQVSADAKKGFFVEVDFTFKESGIKKPIVM